MRPPHPYGHRRRPTRAVMIGDVGVGGRHPIRVQSMTTPATTDTAATVAQVERLVGAGCEIVRLTVPSKADADALPVIRRELARRRLRVPLVADIHFTPAAAMLAVEHVEKVRINPGNFADRKKFAAVELDEDGYRRELERVAERFRPLVRRARELGVAMRIGTNHGSLSDRVMSRYGDTPLGMVESALEFVRIARDEGYHDLVLSMKSSNPLVAIEAYRELVAAMDREGMDYPLHLGVTEAGDGEDGRIKSAVGIGALLEEGLGDTVRVSLTEDPVAEIPVCLELVRPYNRDFAGHPGGIVPELATVPAERPRGLAAGRRPSREVALGPTRIGGGAPVGNEVRLRTPLHDTDRLHHEIAAVAGYSLAAERRAELLVADVASPADAAALVELKALFDEHGVRVPLAARLAPALAVRIEKLDALDALMGAVRRISALPPADLDEPSWRAAMTAIAATAHRHSVALLLEATPSEVPGFLRSRLPEPDFEGPVETLVTAAQLARAAGAEALAGCFTLAPPGPTAAARLLIARLDALGLDLPHVALDLGGAGRDPLLAPSLHLGALLADGLADLVRVERPPGSKRDLDFAWDLLQAARQRVVKAEFISCPSCGRTLFDLEETTARIKQRTSHLRGVRIAIMGCVVNGPGEMADADFGYVGWGPGKVALFVGKQMVAKDVPTAEADLRLIEVIREHGKWVDPAPGA